jgi:cell division protein FtsN
MGRVLAVALAITLLGFGVPALHAKDKASQQVCSSTVTQSCTPVVQPQQSCATCPVDPKKVAKEQKAEEHAQHEAAEACERNQKKIAHYQHEAEEDQARANEHMSKANELTSNMCCKPSEPVAESKPVESETSIAIVEPTPAPEVTPPPAPAPQVTLPPPAPIAEYQPPKELPRTASPMSLIGLVGLLSMSGSLTGFFRRR